MIRQRIRHSCRALPAAAPAPVVGKGPHHRLLHDALRSSTAKHTLPGALPPPPNGDGLMRPCRELCAHIRLAPRTGWADFMYRRATCPGAQTQDHTNRSPRERGSLACVRSQYGPGWRGARLDYPPNAFAAAVRPRHGACHPRGTSLTRHHAGCPSRRQPTRHDATVRQCPLPCTRGENTALGRSLPVLQRAGDRSHTRGPAPWRQSRLHVFRLPRPGSQGTTPSPM